MEQTLPKLLQRVAKEHPDTPSHYFRTDKEDFKHNTFSYYYDIALTVGAGLLDIGVKRADRIGLISDNRKEWSFFDMGLLSIGAIDVPRGSDTSESDLSYILSFSECEICAVENEVLLLRIISLKKNMPKLKTFICFEQPQESALEEAKKAGFTVYTFDEIVSFGKTYREKNSGAVEAELEKGEWDELASIIFTSGTTGEPKGVMLSHGNFLTQLDELPERVSLHPGDKALCVLPIWHSFERICEYVILNGATAVCYSKPVGSVLLADFQTLNPQLMPAVPRVFEAIYDGIFKAMRKTGGITLALFTFFVNIAILHSKIDRKIFGKQAEFTKQNHFLYAICLGWLWLLLAPFKALGGVLVFKKIRAKLGTSFTSGISGGGALPPAVDEFFWAVGVNIIEGYGLTETAPVVSLRPSYRPIFGTVGSPIRGVEVRIVDENGNPLPAGQKGVVQVRGGIVMKGYYKRDDLTSEVMKGDGWLDTGDIGKLTIHGELALRGRMKDTIVLRGGENIEPLPIEMALNESRYIISSMVVGQNEKGIDQRYLGALIVPSEDEVCAYAAEHSISFTSYEELLQKEEVKALFSQEIRSHISSKNGFRAFEVINRFELLPKAFELGVELSIKQEIMRHKIRELYADRIAQLFV